MNKILKQSLGQIQQKLQKEEYFETKNNKNKNKCYSYHPIPFHKRNDIMLLNHFGKKILKTFFAFCCGKQDLDIEEKVADDDVR